jgi:hypothetical protein
MAAYRSQRGEALGRANDRTQRERRLPLVDTNALLAIETLFREGPTDPWASVLAGHFADLFVYFDAFRFTHPLPSMDVLPGATVPELARRLRTEDPQVAVSAVCTTADPRVISDRYVAACVDGFRLWSEAYARELRLWVTTQREPWMGALYDEQFARDCVFDRSQLLAAPGIRAIIDTTGLQEEDVLHAFDSIVRFPIYGEIAGRDSFYLNHPIRDAFPLPTMRQSPAPCPHMPVSWAKSASAIARHCTLEEFVEFLFELKSEVQVFRATGAGLDRPGREMVREVAAHVGLPARLKRVPEIAAVTGGVLSALALIPDVGPMSAFLGGAVSVSSAFWKGGVGRRVGRIRWLRWALSWDVEDDVQP